MIPDEATRKTDSTFISVPPTKPKGAKAAFNRGKNMNPHRPLAGPPNPVHNQTKKNDLACSAAALVVIGIDQSDCATSPTLLINPKRKKSEKEVYRAAAERNALILFVSKALVAWRIFITLKCSIIALIFFSILGSKNRYK